MDGRFICDIPFSGDGRKEYRDGIAVSRIGIIFPLIIKGRIIFSQQLRRNVLAPTRFFCRFSKYIADYDLNQFFKTCLIEMERMSRDNQNKIEIEYLLPFFDEITHVEPDVALGLGIEFNSVNSRAIDAYTYGRMFLESIHTTMNSGATQVYTMLFNMDQLYELFVYRVASIVYGNRITYQKMGNHLVVRNSDGKRFVSLRPDLTFRISEHEQWIIDTKWKMPGRFAKESDVYQMNAYSTGIKNIRKVILLYPRITKSEHISGAYTLVSAQGDPKPLEIKMIDLMECLSWNSFLKSFKRLLLDT